MFYLVLSNSAYSYSTDWILCARALYYENGKTMENTNGISIFKESYYPPNSDVNFFLVGNSIRFSIEFVFMNHFAENSGIYR